MSSLLGLFTVDADYVDQSFSPATVGHEHPAYECCYAALEQDDSTSDH